MFLLLTMLCFSELTIDASKNWESLASVWMTAEEQALFQSLDEAEREVFKGYFVARRLDKPQSWPSTGLYLPAFFCPTNHGDIRDQLLFALGKPKDEVVQPGAPNLPQQWHYGSAIYHFEPAPGQKVKLAEQSVGLWEQVKQKMIKWPQIRYDFRINSFGRTRLIEDLTWQDTKVLSKWVVPEEYGASLYVQVEIPEAYRAYVNLPGRNPVQHMEGLFLLRGPQGETMEQLQKLERVRHSAHRLHFVDDRFLQFQVHVPAGLYEVELLMFSGFLDKGLKTKFPVHVLPQELPRISDPILCQNYGPQQIQVQSPMEVFLNGTTYKMDRLYDKTKPARVLVKSHHYRTELLLQKSDGKVKPLSMVGKDQEWVVFDLPAQAEKYRLIALGHHERGSQVALSSRGESFGRDVKNKLRFRQKDLKNYLGTANMTLDGFQELALLYVNGFPLVASRSGSFAWPAMDWGEEAELRFEFGRESSWERETYKVFRDSVYQQIRVAPKFVVAGTRNLYGEAVAQDFKILLDDAPAKIVKRRPMAEVPKLWGIVVNDPLLKSPAWTNIREVMASWLKSHTNDEDEIYIVHVSHRPELVLAPTQTKTLVRAALNRLVPKTKNESYYTIGYLIDELTHLSNHKTRPHQVLFLTHQLTDDVDQMQALLPRLRDTGLQIYNLEFPFEFRQETEEKVAKLKPKALDVMARRELEDQRERQSMRDNFQEQRNVTAGWGFRFGGEKKRKKEKEDEMRREAFKRSFNDQLALLTAGKTVTSGFGETIQSLTQFFEDLSRWQESLVHVTLEDKALAEERIRLLTEDGYQVSWTLVEWK